LGAVPEGLLDELQHLLVLFLLVVYVGRGVSSRVQIVWVYIIKQKPITWLPFAPIKSIQ
jgi:hypothetical protein